MNNTSILNSVSSLKGFVSELKQTVFRPKIGSFLYLSRSIQRYIAMIDNRCKICSSYIGKNERADNCFMIITREIEDIRKMIFNHSEESQEFLETEENIYDCFDQIEMNIEYLESMFTPEVAQ